MRLKELRQSMGYTQEQLAAMLKTTQQSIARWETGKVEPNISALRDLAIIFGTSVDDLLGINPFSNKPISNHYILNDENGEHFWGHVGVMLPGQQLSQWYPITLKEANRISTALYNIETESQWIQIATLNNRMLVINGLAAKCIQILDDNADQVTDDWDLGWDSYQGYSPEVYRALAEWYSDSDEEYSEAFTKTIEDIIEEEELTEELIWERIIKTIVHFRDGSTQSLWVEEVNLWQIVSGLEWDQMHIFDLSNNCQGLDRYISSASVHMIDMPLYQVVDAAKAEHQELMTEIEKTEAVEKGKKGRTGPRKKSQE